MSGPKRAEWVFDALPPSGARRGGNPAEHAFTHDLGTFVREVVQNANDQAQTSPRVVFRLCPLQGDELKRFLAALEFSSLRPHLEAAAKTRGGPSMRRALEELAEREELLVMFVEDFGTEGLTGDESEGESHFRALCKDTLFSHKRETTAGGSYGLGKSVLWIFSALSTVLFDSTLVECPKGVDNPRFIGRVELPSHRIDQGDQRGDYSGAGWFGLRARRRDGERAESMWGEPAREHARDLGFRDRKDHEIGTSICIVGFRDPTADEESNRERLVERTRRAIETNFWPAMHLPLRPLRAEVGLGNELVQVTTNGTDVAPFLEAWEHRASSRESLDNAGDVVVRAIPFHVPPRHDGEGGVDGAVHLLVRLDSERTTRRRTGEVAVFRGPGMVVKYWDRSRIALGLRPFHAVLACGLARDPRNPSASDIAIESFLRLAEPPSHDDWISTPRLKEAYKPGYRKALEDLKASVDEALRSLLVVGPNQGKRGPERLQKRFPIGKKGAIDKRPSAFRIHGLSAELAEDGWHFRGAIEPSISGLQWRAELRVAEVDERGARSDSVPILSLEADGDAAIQIDDGVAFLVAPAEAHRLSFRGRTAASPCIGALEIEIAGRLEEGVAS